MVASIFLVLALYCLLLNPAFTFTGGKHLSLFLWPLIVLLCNKNVRRGFSVFNVMVRIWGIILIYIIIRTLMGGDVKFLIGHFYLFIDILVSYILVYFSILHKIDIVKALLVVACVAGVISCICLFFPAFHEFTRSIQVITNEDLLELSYRGFGIGEGLTFTYGVILGVICALGICHIKKYLWFLLFVPFISVAILINARVGFIPVIIAFFVFFISEHKISYFFTFLLFVFATWILWNAFIIDIFPEDTLDWLLMFFYELGEGTEGGTFKTLMNTTIWPDGLFEWLFGKGRDVFDPTKMVRTDIGYLIQLCYGGLIYCFLLLIFVYSIFKPAYNSIKKSFFIILFVSCVIFNYKGSFFTRNSALVLYILIMLYYTQHKHYEMKKQNNMI